MFQYQIVDPICRQEIPFVSGRFLMSAGKTFFWWEITFAAGRSIFFGERSLLSVEDPFCRQEISFVGIPFVN
jgi:hypothetical protein